MDYQIVGNKHHDEETQNTNCLKILSREPFEQHVENRRYFLETAV